LTLIRTESHNYEEIALDYIHAGLYDEAVAILQLCIDKAQPSPMAFYYQGWALSLAGKTADANSVFEIASKQNPDCCFPNRLEAILALQCAINSNPNDGYAPYYLGNLWYDKQQFADAINCWEASAAINPDFPTVLRNLSLAAFNKQHDSPKAVTLLEKAFTLEESDARILMELDQLYKRLNHPHAERLAFLEKHADLVKMRDDLYLEYATLHNQTGKYESAKALIDARRFHPWEGGEGKAPAQYQTARLELAKIALDKKEFQTAEALLAECFEYPHNLGEGKLPGAQENDFNYFLGCTYEGMNQPEKARACYESAAVGISEPAAAIYYNDQKPDKIFYQGLALLKLGRKEEARSRFNKLISYGEKHLFDQVKIDYFAVSLPDLLIWDDDFTHRNVIHCHYMMGLGYLGLGNADKAKQHLQKAFALDNNHQGVQAHLAMIY
ncbi:MAG: tetratricopeptide repeat protein, partial [Bacteroidota bacterium]|nr:tetratricopeptide repeat protein [Bacteroidota bacterium]